MKNPTAIYTVLIIFSALGIINAGYLAITALSGNVPTCNFIHGCDLVAKSPHSYFLGIPLSLYGVFFYSLVGGFSIWGLINKQVNPRMLIVAVTGVGFLLSLYLLYLQAFVIYAYCEYCLFSLFDATVLFIVSFFLPKERHGILDETTNTKTL